MAFSTETLLRNLLTELARYGLQPQVDRPDGDGKLIHLDVGETVIEVEVTSHNPVHYEIGVTRSADAGFCGPAHELYRDIAIVARRVAWLELHNQHTELRRVNRFLRQVRTLGDRYLNGFVYSFFPFRIMMAADPNTGNEREKASSVQVFQLRDLARQVDENLFFEALDSAIGDWKETKMLQMRPRAEPAWAVRQQQVSVQEYRSRVRAGIVSPVRPDGRSLSVAQDQVHAAGFGCWIGIGPHVLYYEPLVPFRM